MAAGSKKAAKPKKAPCQDCGVVIEDGPTGLLVSHPARLGGYVSGSLQDSEVNDWLERVHAQEST